MAWNGNRGIRREWIGGEREGRRIGREEKSEENRRG